LASLIAKEEREPTQGLTGGVDNPMLKANNIRGNQQSDRNKRTSSTGLRRNEVTDIKILNVFSWYRERKICGEYIQNIIKHLCVSGTVWDAENTEMSEIVSLLYRGSGGEIYMPRML
jgi:hypothetical protein